MVNLWQTGRFMGQPAGAVGMSDATKVVIGTIAVSALLVLAIIVNQALV